MTKTLLDPLIVTSNAFSDLQEFFTKMNVLAISESLYYRYLRNLVYPVVHLYWKEEQSNLVQELKVSLSKMIRDHSNCHPSKFEILKTQCLSLH